MNKIDKKFLELKKENKKAFIAFITAGIPSLKMTGDIVLTLEKSGADIIELGIPFSDPLADGPTIQEASLQALKKNINLKKILNFVKDLRKKTDIPIIFMTYFNPILKLGIERFINDCKISKVDGLIIPDLPYEEACELIKLSKKKEISTIFLVAPTSTNDRIKNITRFSTGFIYYVSLTGVTGTREKLPSEITTKIKLVKSMTKKPVAVGFGVSKPEQAKTLAKIADGIIVGSAIVKIILKNISNKEELLNKLEVYSKTMANAIHGIKKI